MTQELTRKPTVFRERARVLATKTPGYRLALAAILLLSAFLNLYNLTGEGYGNSYYSAAVKTCSRAGFNRASACWGGWGWRSRR